MLPVNSIAWHVLTTRKIDEACIMYLIAVRGICHHVEWHHDGHIWALVRAGQIVLWPILVYFNTSITWDVYYIFRVIHLSTAFLIPVRNLPVESMLIAQQQELVPFASADLTMKEIHLSSATSTLANRVLVVLMLTAQPLVNVLCASVEVVTLATHSQSVVWNLALPALVAQMLTAHLLEGLKTLLLDICWP